MAPLFFDSWDALWRTTIIGVLAYASMLFMLRISGSRTLSKMNAFDLVVTVSLGSTLANVLLNKDVTLAQGSLAFALLIGLQFAVTWTSARATWFRKIVTGEPSLLLYEGAYLPDALLRSRVTDDEVRAAVRASGIQALGDVKAVVLETDGSFSVVKLNTEGGAASLEGVRMPRRIGVRDG
jgi:uncharacterized membrane protein YcaP (DUF421 family)